MKIDSSVLDKIRLYVFSYCKTLPYGEVILEEEFVRTLPSIYYSYPFLFVYSFSDKLDKTTYEFLQKLSLIGFLIYRSSVIKDRLIDNDDLNKISKIGRSNYIHTEEVCSTSAVKLLNEIFQKDSSFWELLRKRKEEYNKATEWDRELKLGVVDIAAYRTFSDYKSALGKLAIDALFIFWKKNQSNKYNDLLYIHKSFSTALQLEDDSSDIFQDKQNLQFNYCLNILEEYRYAWKKCSSERELKTLFYKSGVAEEAILLALEELKVAIDVIRNHNNLILQNFLQNFTKQLEVKLFTIRNYKYTTEKRNQIEASFPTRSFEIKEQISIVCKNKSVNRKCIELGIKALLQESNNDFLEMKHIMWLPNYEGFKGEDTTYVGDVFQKAILVCFLSDLENYGAQNQVIKEIINKQISALIKLRRKTSIGGWSYLPEAMEIAPDADDLGQILQCFVSSNRQDLIKTYCTTAINTLLSDCSTVDGGIKTWIIPQKARSKVEEMQLLFNKTKWGEGPDTEVVANFLYGLFLYDAKKYSKIIIRGADFLLRRVEKEGFWKSRWYYGDYYGTYICTQFLRASNLLPLEIENKITSFLISRQNTDGGWGLSVSSDPLSTAFALVTLSGQQQNLNVQKGLKYLESQQMDSGFWQPVNFIKPRAVEPYKSKIITTIFVLRAFLNKVGTLSYGTK